MFLPKCFSYSLSQSFIPVAFITVYLPLFLLSWFFILLVQNFLKYQNFELDNDLHKYAVCIVHAQQIINHFNITTHEVV